MPRFKLIVAYDGTNYHGFARQDNAITVQEVLEHAIEVILRMPIEIEGAGRTDRGVHAEGQCCIFDAETAIPTENMKKALNSKLPQDIVVKEVVIAPSDFHPRFAAKRKIYRYQILMADTRDPFLCKYSYFYPKKLDVELMKEAAESMVGEHDFKCFCAAGSTVLSTVRTIYDISITKQEDIITVDVCGNGFLYNMVRIIVGTLLQVGIGRIAADQIRSIIESKDRRLAGPTAPPEGLRMLKIYYEEE